MRRKQRHHFRKQYSHMEGNQRVNTFFFLATERKCLRHSKHLKRQTYIFIFFAGELHVEISELQQYHPQGKLYRIKGRKGHRLNMDQFNLFVFHSKTKLTGEWQKKGDNTHLFSDIYAKMNASGVMMRKYYTNKEREVLPGVPKLFLSNDQWFNLMGGLPDVQKMLYPTSLPGPCFSDKETHFDGESFIGCPVCLPFVN